ncbi:ABC transporter permease [Mycolicibacterium thermoresistibile]
MTTLAAVNAERIKLLTTRAPLWSALGVAVLALGMAALQGLTSHNYSSLPPQQAALGVVLFGVPVLMILAALTVTGEYRSGTIHTTFLTVPRRSLAVAAKAVVAALFCGGWAALMTLAALIVARASAKPLVAAQLALTGSAGWRVIGGVTAYAMIAAVLGVAVGVLLRTTAGAMAVLLLWPLILEPILANMPDVAPVVGPYLPFGNVLRFLEVRWLYPSFDAPWGGIGSLVYFAVVVAVLGVAAVVVVNRRDA